MDKKLLESLRARMPWTIASRSFKVAGLRPGQGWQKTAQRLSEAEDGVIEDKLRSILLDHVVFGEKFTKFYFVSDRDKDLILKHFQSNLIPTNPISEAFPISVDPSEFAKFQGKQVLAANISDDEGAGVVLTTEMRLTTRELISEDALFSNPAEIRVRYDEIVGLKHKSFQVFNVVWMPKNSNYLEIRVDCPAGIPIEAVQQMHAVIRSDLEKQVGSAQIGFSIDLFPVINSIYEDTAEGRVVELGFTTSTGSVKLEKMRRTSTCLREELYHIGGKKELGTQIDPYRVSVTWEFGTDDALHQPELTITGTSRGTHSGRASGALISLCSGRIDYEFVRERIVSHLETIAQRELAATAAQ